MLFVVGVTTNLPEVNVTVPPVTLIVCPSVIGVPSIAVIVNASLSASISPFKTSTVIGVSSVVVTLSSSATGASLTAFTVIATVSVSLNGVPSLSVETIVKLSEPL